MTSKAKLSLLLLIMASPLLASYSAYYFFWHPTKSVNYGELLPIRPVSLQSLQSIGVNSVDSIRGKWVLLSVDSGNCNAACAQKLYLMRQIRTAQGREMERVARAYVIDDNAAHNAEFMKQYEGTVVLRSEPRVLGELPAADGVRSHIYLLDPLGNVVLRYPPNPDAKRMMKDWTRLLSVSQIG